MRGIIFVIFTSFTAFLFFHRGNGYNGTNTTEAQKINVKPNPEIQPIQTTEPNKEKPRDVDQISNTVNTTLVDLLVADQKRENRNLDQSTNLNRSFGNE